MQKISILAATVAVINADHEASTYSYSTTWSSQDSNSWSSNDNTSWSSMDNSSNTNGAYWDYQTGSWSNNGASTTGQNSNSNSNWQNSWDSNTAYLNNQSSQVNQNTAVFSNNSNSNWNTYQPSNNYSQTSPSRSSVFTNFAKIYSCDFKPEYCGECPNYYGCATVDYISEFPNRDSCSCLDFCDIDPNCCTLKTDDQARTEKAAQQAMLKANAGFQCSNRPWYSGECPNYNNCHDDPSCGCNCLDFCGFDDRCCSCENYSCSKPPVYKGNCPNYFGCATEYPQGTDGPCNCLSYCEWDDNCCEAVPEVWKEATAPHIAILADVDSQCSVAPAPVPAPAVNTGCNHSGCAAPVPTPVVTPPVVAPPVVVVPVCPPRVIEMITVPTYDATKTAFVDYEFQWSCFRNEHLNFATNSLAQAQYELDGLESVTTKLQANAEKTNLWASQARQLVVDAKAKVANLEVLAADGC